MTSKLSTDRSLTQFCPWTKYGQDVWIFLIRGMDNPITTLIKITSKQLKNNSLKIRETLIKIEIYGLDLP